MISSARKRNKEILFLLLCLMGLVLFQNIATPGVFHDGLIYGLLGRNASDYGNWLVPSYTKSLYSEFLHHPPFMFILEGAFFKVFGFSWLTARAFNLLIVLCLVIFLYMFCKKEKTPFHSFLVSISLVLFFPFMKKARFPNLDFLLTLFSFVSLFVYYEYCFKKNEKWWACGLFFGLALLTKGPPAFTIPLIISTHLLVHKRLLFLSIKPWMGLIFGFIIFLQWPLLLYLNDKLYVFINYFKIQFVTSIINGRGVENFDFLQYWKFLVLYAGPLPILGLIGIILNLKKIKSDPLYSLFFISFFMIIFPFSFIKLKYSNYLIPSYPGLAFFSGTFLYKFFKNYEEKFLYYFKTLILILSLFQVIYPVTNKISRDKVLFDFIEMVDSINYQEKNWLIVNDSYPFLSFKGVILWEKNIDPQMISPREAIDRINNSEESDVIIVHKKFMKEILENKNINSKYYLLSNMENLNLFVRKRY